MIDLRQAATRPLFRVALESNLRRLGLRRKVYAHFVDAVRLQLDADAAWLLRTPEGEGFRSRTVDGDAALCEPALAAAFARAEHPEIPRDRLLAPVRVYDRLVAVAGAGRRGRDFELGDGRLLSRLCEVLAGDLERREDERLERVLDRLRSKVVAELRPRDLAYQILDGLYELVDYDHSAALLTLDEAAGVFRVQAEKIVWRKAKSAFVGHEIAADPALIQAVKNPRGLRLRGEEGTAAESDAEALRRRLDYHAGRPGTPPVASLLAAPLFFEEEFLGFLKMAGWRRPPFDRRDVDVVERFLPMAAVAVRNAHDRLALEDQAIRAEVRAGLSVLARAVAHDVNNAMGALLPLAQQARDDVARGEIDRDTLAGDLDQIIGNARLCKRIFGNMLRLGLERDGSGPLNVNRAVEEMLPLLEPQLRRGGVELRLELAPELPQVRFSQHHFERIVWNLVRNALEAMAGADGRLTLASRARPGGGVVLAVSDSGPGIPPEEIERVAEPFYTTKSQGTGLGLAICRSLAWHNGGSFRIASAAGRGTTVEIGLPAAAEEGAA